jgi:hypothetical protein
LPANPSLNQPFRLTGFTLDANNNALSLKIYNGTINPINQIRIDQNEFLNCRNEGSENNRAPFLFQGTIYGVIDNNTFSGTVHIDNGGLQVLSWTNLFYTYGTADNIYYEDNVFNSNYTLDSGVWGGRYCNRYNTYNISDDLYPMFDAHGNQESGVYTNMGVEIYGNLVNAGSKNIQPFIGQRGGKALVFCNRINTTGGVFLRVDEEYGDELSPPVLNPTDGTPQHVNNSYYWNNRKNTTLVNPYIGANICNKPPEACQANHDYASEYYYFIPTTDSKGNAWRVTDRTGEAPFTTGTVEPDWNSKRLGETLVDNKYVWRNHGISNTPLVENREFWVHNINFNGTTGMGCGTFAHRPTTCTPGVAYWATNQDCTQVSANSVGPHPLAPISGTLYKCTAPNTWEVYYTPFPYPHPLRVSGPVADNETQTIPLPAGWNWISFNVLPAYLSLNSIFISVLNNVEQVKAQTQSAMRSSGIWKGDLADMAGIGQYKMFKMKVSQACTLTLTGTAVLSATPIQLAGGWNWVAYLPTTAMPIATALDSIKGQVLEVKSLTQSATYNSSVWSGTLTQLAPGQGYAIKMSGPGTLIYPTTH